MSDDHRPHPPDPEQHSARLIALVAGGWLVLVVLMLLVTRWWELRSLPWPPAVPAPVRGQREVADVNQRPFALEDEARRLLAGERARLDAYGWVDRDAGLIHVPVDAAVERVLAEEGRGP